MIATETNVVMEKSKKNQILKIIYRKKYRLKSIISIKLKNYQRNFILIEEWFDFLGFALRQYVDLVIIYTLPLGNIFEVVWLFSLILLPLFLLTLLNFFLLTDSSSLPKSILYFWNNDLALLLFFFPFAKTESLILTPFKSLEAYFRLLLLLFTG